MSTTVTTRTISVVALALGLGVCLFASSGCKFRQPVEPGLNTDPVGPAAPSDVLSAKPEWFGCNKDTDCRVEPGVCGNPQAVNAAFLIPFRVYRDEMAQMVDCAIRQVRPETVTARCILKRCNAIPAGKASRKRPN